MLAAKRLKKKNKKTKKPTSTNQSPIECVGEMEKADDHHVLEQNQENLSSHHHHQNPKPDTPTDPPRINNERVKRDEWSEGAVSTLLQAYEAKWTLRNRAKLKGHDWEDVAKGVSAREAGSKSAKTHTQCKNKIESMKKRYRLESAAPDASSWPLYPRLDLLLRGTGGGPSAPAAANPPPPVGVVELGSQPPSEPTLQVLEPGGVAQNSHGSNGVDWLAKGDGGNNGAKPTNHEAEKAPMISIDTDSSTPAVDTKNASHPVRTRDKAATKTKRRREERWEIGESIRWAAEVVVRSEEARIGAMREIERMRAEADARRGEMELKRTEIIASTQLQIAKLFAKTSLPFDS